MEPIRPWTEDSDNFHVSEEYSIPSSSITTETSSSLRPLVEGSNSSPLRVAVGSVYSSASDEIKDNVKNAIFKSSSDMVLQTGKSIATELQSVAQFDKIRPFFDVKNKEVLKRFVMPYYPTSQSLDLVDKPDLYGPIMAVCTLVAVLLMGMNFFGTSDQIRDATLLGTAFFTTVLYWFLSSLSLFLSGFVLEHDLSFVQALHIVGYPLGGTIAALILGFVLKGFLLIFVLLVVGGMPAVFQVLSIKRHCKVDRQGIVLGSFIGVLHVCFLFYLKLVYHSMIESIIQS